MESMHHSEQDHLHTEETFEQANALVANALDKEKQSRRMQRGVIWMAVGAVILVLSFGINLLCFQCGVDFHLPMYVLTTLGALSLLKGMMDIF